MTYNMYVCMYMCMHVYMHVLLYSVYKVVYRGAAAPKKFIYYNFKRTFKQWQCVHAKRETLTLI